MKKPKIALKPYLEMITEYCRTLSKEEMTDLVVSFAKDTPTSSRVGFLEKFESYLSGGRRLVLSEKNPVEQILSDIDALRESIEERITSIEDGSYWDDPALFKLMADIGEEAYFSPDEELDIREARARYCRCVYETSDPGQRLEEFVEAMDVDAASPYDETLYDEHYPLMQDVIDSKPDDMEGLESFLPAWKKALTEKGTRGRPAGLLLETINRLEGISGVSRLAEKWKNSQPLGYLFWLNILKKENDLKGIISVSEEGLKALREGRAREQVAEFMIDAAKDLNDPGHILSGKRERFFSEVNDQNLLELVEESTSQDLRDEELAGIIRFFRTRKSVNEQKEELYAKALLMAGKVNDTMAMAKNERGVGWSYGSSAGLAFGSVLSVLAGHSERAGIIKNLLKGYANKISEFSEDFSINDGPGTSFYDEIIKGLKQENDATSLPVEAFSWAEKIGRKRIEHIVSNKHRRAYKRAAQVLGSLAEAHVAMGREGKAKEILHEYYSEKYNRFSAFRREVKKVVTNSDLLKNPGFLD